MKRLLLLTLAVLTLQSCSWIRSWGDDEEEPGAPKALVDFSATLATREIWTVSAGKGVGPSAHQLHPAHRDGTLFTADYEGRIMAIGAETGRRLWEVETELPLSGGPGLGRDLLFVGTENGEVLARRLADGAEVWRAQVSSEVLAAPISGDGIVVVRCIDGRVFGLDERDGSRRWIYDHAVPLLTLRGNSQPVIWAGIVFIGYDGGEVVALELDEGSPVWQQEVVTNEGRSELERLADIDGQLVYVASDLIVASYKSRVSSLAADSGRLLWFKDIASATGVTVDRTNLAISDRDGNVWLLDRRNGSTFWKLEQLQNRGLTRPAFMGDFVVVGDFEGYLHWINIDSGEVAAREKVGGDGFVAAPIVVGNRLYAMTVDGELAAFGAGGGG